MRFPEIDDAILHIPTMPTYMAKNGCTSALRAVSIGCIVKVGTQYYRAYLASTQYHPGA
jgi:hypothetical protein